MCASCPEALLGMNNKCSGLCRWVSVGQPWQDSSEDISGAGEEGLLIYTALSLLRPHPLQQQQMGGGGCQLGFQVGIVAQQAGSLIPASSL